jgi:hypothetical protein
VNIPNPPPQDPDWGFDEKDFWSLAGRLVPCGPAHFMIAADLKHRLLSWCNDDQRWDFVPPVEYTRTFAEIDSWRAVAPGAVDALVSFLECEKNDPGADKHFDRFMVIQDTFMRAQGFACAWQGGWLYRSLLLDHRWLLHGFRLPPFDEYIFSVMVGSQCGGFSDAETVRWLQKDPIIAAMPAMHEYVFPESWKTGVILMLMERGIHADADDIDQAVERMAACGRFTPGQASALCAHHGCLFGEAGATTMADVATEVASARLDAPEVGRDYVPFSLPTADRAFFVNAPPRTRTKAAP